MAKALAPPPSAARFAWLDKVRAGIVVVLVIAATLAVGLYVVVHWAERQILNTDNWVALVSPLPKQPVVSTALGSYISEQVFVTDTVKAKITDALPPKAAFLAGPLTSQLKTLTTRAAQKVVASDGFQTIWTAANRIAMTRVLAQARGQTPKTGSKLSEKFNINLGGTSGKLQGALGGVASAIPALQPASQKALSISADLKSRPKRVSQYVKTIDNLAATLPYIIGAVFLGALALAKQRRRLMLVSAVAIIFMMLVELVALKWAHGKVLDQVQVPGNVAAVSYISDTLTGWLHHMIYIVLTAMAILAVILLIAGPADWAEKSRQYIRTDYLKQSTPMQWWRQLRQKGGAYEYYGWLGIVLIVLAGTALAQTVNGRVVLNATLLMLALIAALHIVVTPPYSEE